MPPPLALLGGTQNSLCGSTCKKRKERVQVSLHAFFDFRFALVHVVMLSVLCGVVPVLCDAV
jgi:hypothetical protein